VIHATRRIAVLLVLLVAVAAGCSRGGSATPKAAGMRSRANNWGRYGVVHSPATGVKSIVKGSWKCTASVDKGKKTATTDCTGKSGTGQTVTLHSVSTFAELSKYKVRALPGEITIKVDGVTKATPTCVGPLCPKAAA
jgi:hypothetical protein